MITRDTLTAKCLINFDRHSNLIFENLEESLLQKYLDTGLVSHLASIIIGFLFLSHVWQQFSIRYTVDGNQTHHLMIVSLLPNHKTKRRTCGQSYKCSTIVSLLL